MRLTDSQAGLFKALGFRTLKTKADYHSDALNPDEYVLFETTISHLQCYTMRGKYGTIAFMLPAVATAAEIVTSLLKVRNNAFHQQPKYADQADLHHLLHNDLNLSDKLQQVAEMGWLAD